MGCQTQIAAQIIERKGGYWLNAKDNQPKLAEAIEEFIRIGEQHAWKNLKPSQFETLDKGHGRIETRRCVALPVPDYIPEIKGWPGIKCIARIEAIRASHGKVTSEVRYLIGSMVPNAQIILNATRLHWGVRNGLHRCLDVAFREDASAVHLCRAAANLGVMPCYFLRREDPTSIARLFFRASYLCKADTKSYGSGCHGFGASRC